MCFTAGMKVFKKCYGVCFWLYRSCLTPARRQRHGFHVSCLSCPGETHQKGSLFFDHKIPVIKLSHLYIFGLFVFAFSSFSAEPSSDTPPPPVNMQRTIYLNRLESVETYRPQSREEALYYLQLHEFLSKNKTAQALLFSARHNPSHYRYLLEELNKKHLNPINNLKSVGRLLQNNVDLKGRVDIGKTIAGTGAVIELEVDLGGVAKDVAGGIAKHWTSEEDKIKNLEVEQTARFWTKEQYACLENRNCLINTLQLLNNALVNVGYHFDNMPQMQDKTTKQKLSFEAMKERNPSQAELAQDFFTLSQVEKGTEQLSQEEQETRDSIIGKINQIHQEQEKARQKKLEQAKEEAISRILSDPVEQQDPLIVSARNHIKAKKNDKTLLEGKLKKGAVPQAERAEYEEQIQKIDQNIQKTEKSIDGYEFKKGVQETRAWTGAVVSLAQITGAPKEILQVGTAINHGLDIAGEVGAMIIAGALDPTGLTLIANSVGAVVSIFSGVPSTDQVIIQNLSALREGQAEIISQLKGMDSKLDILDEKVDDLIRYSQMNHEEVMGGFETVQNQLQQMESDILVAVDEAKQLTCRGFQQGLTGYILDGEVAVATGFNLDEYLAKCQMDKKQDEKTRNVRWYHDYKMCMLEANREFRDVNNKLNELQIKSSAQLKSDTFIQKEALYTLNEETTKNKFGVDVEDRAGLLSSVFNWLDGQYNNSIKSNLIINDLWNDHFQQKWNNYGLLLNTMSADSGRLYHPESYDEAFSAYIKNSARLPSPERLDFLFSEYPEQSFDQEGHNRQLENMCQNVKNIEEIADSSRQNLPSAYAIYLYFLGKFNSEIQKSFSSLIRQLEDSYGDYVEAQENITFEPKSIEECGIESAYSHQQTDIFQYIADEDYTVSDFLSANPRDMAVVASWRPYLDEEYLKSQGFSYVHPTETDCETRNGWPIDKGLLESSFQVQDLENTLEKVQKGEQGGCWFYDVYGLISGVKKQKIQLYQKVNINPATGEDYGYYPDFKPMCAVFVTAVQGKWFLWNDWDEPDERAICLQADLRFIYDSLGTGFFNSRNFKHRLYYLDEDSIQAGQVPKRVSAIEYKNRLWNITKDKLTREEKNRIRNNLGHVRYANEGVSISHHSHTNWYNTAVRKLVDQWGLTDHWYGLFSMRIDNINNANNMGKQEWVNNVARNRDSIGTCRKYACLKPRPKIVANWNGWIDRASEQIKMAQTELETQLTNMMGPGSFLSLHGQLKKEDGRQIPGDLSYPGLVRAILSLDTIARVGYGHHLEGQPELAELLQKALTLKSNLLNDGLSLPAKVEAVMGAFDEQIVKPLKADENILKLPVAEVAPGSAQGWGRPDLRHEALRLVSRRDYLSPPACHF